MTWDSFLKGIKLLNAAMGRKMTAADAELVWDLVEFIPESAWDDITKTAISKWDAWPRNLVMSLKDLWYSYQSEHHAHDDRSYTECDYCRDSTGIIFVERLEPNEMDYYDTGVCRCGHCTNWKGYMSEKTKKLKHDEIRDKGYRVSY